MKTAVKIAAVFAAAAFQANAEVPVYEVPSFSVSDLAIHSEGTVDQLKRELYANGIVSVDGIVNFDQIQKEAVEAFHECISSVEDVSSYELEDGTMRTSLGVHVHGNRALPFQVSSDCATFASASANLQTSVSEASDAFFSALDSVLGTRATIKRKGAEDYTSVSHALMNANHLEHFHGYSASKTSESTSTESVDWHTDTGMVIAFTPGVFMDDGKMTKATDDLFFIKLSSGQVVRPVFQPNSLVFMLGEAMGKLVDPKLAAVRHSLKVNPVHDERVWYGRMFLPPPDAVFAEGMTFGEFRNRIESGSASAHMKSIGCSGSNDVVGTVQHKRELQLVSDPNCTLANETACWMQCFPVVDCEDGEEMRCMTDDFLTEWVPGLSGADACVDGVQCQVGEHTPGALPRCFALADSASSAVSVDIRALVAAVLLSAIAGLF